MFRLKIWYLSVAVTAIFILNFALTWRDSLHPEVFAVAFSSLSAFSGNYIPMDGEPPQPEFARSVGLLLALSTTLGTALSALEGYWRRQVDRFQAVHSKDNIVIVGSSKEAEVICSSYLPEKNGKNRILRIYENASDSSYGLSIRHGISISDDPVLSKIIHRAKSVIIAASTDQITANLSNQITELRGKNRFEDRLESEVFYLVGSSQLSKAMRPHTLEVLPETSAFHPADEIGQLVASEISKLGSDEKIRVRLVNCGEHVTGFSVKSWIENMERAVRLISPDSPTYVLLDDSSSSEEELRIIVGDPEKVAVETANCAGKMTVLAVAPKQLIEMVSLPYDVKLDIPSQNFSINLTDKKTITVVDPNTWGLNISSICEGISVSWGRAFNDAYNNLYAKTNPNSEPYIWGTEPGGREEQSSIQAARFMLKNLKSRGFQLCLIQDVPRYEWVPNPEDVLYMAKSEHQDWMENRMWVLPGKGKFHVSHKFNLDGSLVPSADCIPFEKLNEDTIEFNKNVITQVYPALAAIFGYQIVPVNGL